MQLKEFNILLDIKKHNKIDYIEVVTGDSFSNVLNISLIDGIYPYDLTNTSVEIVFSKSDGTTVQQTDIAVINSAQGRIQCILKTNTIAVPGKVVAEVRILEGETLLTSTRFEFYVRKSLINDETVESSNEFGTLQQVVLDYNDAIERVNQIEKQVPEQVVTDLNEVSTRVGPLSSLITRIKTSIVNALNGLQTDFNEHKADLALFAKFGMSAVQSIANITATQVLFNQTNSAKDYCELQPDGTVKILKDGVYEVLLYLSYGNNATGYRDVRVDGLINRSSAVSGSSAFVQGVNIVNKTIGQLVTAQAYQTSGGALDLAATSFLIIKKVG